MITEVKGRFDLFIEQNSRQTTVDQFCQNFAALNKSLSKLAQKIDDLNEKYSDEFERANGEDLDDASDGVSMNSGSSSERA